VSRGVLRNPIVQVTLALVVILVIATLTFASAISGALNIQSINLLCVQTADELRKTLSQLNCYHSCRFAWSSRTYMGLEEDRRLRVISYTGKPILPIFFNGV